jgi:hypothetical protein
LACDSRLHIYGSAAHHIKIFRGSDISVTGHVISGMFNGSGTLLTENIPLEIVNYEGSPSIAVKTPVIGGSIETVADGEVVTCVVYSASDEVLSISRMIAVVTNFIRSVDTGKRYVLGIDLISPYLSVSDTHLLEYPYNMIVQSGSMQGRVRYSDGTQEVLPIDGDRFSILGLDNFVTTTSGQTVPLVLKYRLQPNEYGYGVSAPLPDRFLVEAYRLTTIEAQGAYTVKLFVVPYWAVAAGPAPAQWKLKYYLYNMDRDEIIDATSYVTVGGASLPFNGQTLNIRQKITVAVNLHSLNPSYLNYQHIETFAIKLISSGTNALATSYYSIEYQDGMYYGDNVFATAMPDPNNLSLFRLNISQGLGSVDDWLAKIYWPSDPLRYAPAEISAPTPTHVRVKIGNSWVREMELYEAMMNIDGISVTLMQSTPESTARFHIGPERKWSHIAYHFYMATDGTLYQTLPLSWIGIHAPPNFARVGLVLVGRCADPMSDAQREGLPLALDEILTRINAGRNGKAPLTLANVWGHNEVMPGHTDCPGADVLSFLAQAKALPLPTP